jgi:hypothetical protein
VRLGFRAYDPHELLTHFVAERAGLYGTLEVKLVDLRRGEQPHDATVACGSALFAALAGAPIRVLLIAATAPMFWLYGRGARIATYPPNAPPARFLELALAGEKVTYIPARDDAARLALVRSGEADSALLSSATPPSRVPLEERFCLAERVPVPSTGVAARDEPDARAHRLVEAHRGALALIASDEAFARETAQAAFGFDEPEANWAVAGARRWFSADGRVPGDYLSAAVRTVGGEGAEPYAPDAAIDFPAARD